MVAVARRGRTEEMLSLPVEFVGASERQEGLKEVMDGGEVP